MKKTQPGWVSVAIILVLDIIVIMNNQSHENIILMTVISLILLLIMGSLTLSVDDEYVRFSFGIGLIKGKYRISDIVYCRPISYLPLGFGIRIGPGTILYNVGGTKAIELSVRGSGRLIRIGTNFPEEFTEYIYQQKNKIPGNKEDEDFVIRNHKPYMGLAITILILAIVGLFSAFESRDSKIIIGNEKLKISDLYGISIPYESIVSADTIQSMPAIEFRTNGFSLGNVCKGHFKLQDNKKAFLSVNFKYPPFIEINLKDGRVVYFNTRNAGKTREDYNKLEINVKKITH